MMVSSGIRETMRLGFNVNNLLITCGKWDLVISNEILSFLPNTNEDPMKGLFEALKGREARTSDDHKPVFFRLADPSDRQRLDSLLAEEPRITVFDHIHAQLQELVRSLHPARRFTPAELAQAAEEHRNGIPPEEYGVWVYYPWSFRLVHLLDEQEFALVRTDRNRNKISREEQAVLATKKVGVIGLSVGQSVSLAMAMERSFGEIRLADHDTLELSNLNRIRSGTHRMAINKAVNVAREIAEIDPFLKVTCFTDGITKHNIDRFFSEGGPLDVLVEECDSVDMKILSRLKARVLGIPVVMDTSDRGLVDVERFDLEPDRPIIHGRMDHLDLDVIHSDMPPAQKLEYILSMVGMDTLSDRMKASLREIGKTLVTWPQLGAHVVLGGALVADMYRRIALGQADFSGRWYVDLDQVLSAKNSELVMNGSVI